MMLFGGALLAMSVLLLGIYALQKSLGHNLKSADAKPPKLNLEDEAAFSMATVKSVIAQLRADQKTNQVKLLAAERRADEYTRRFELLARELDQGVILFDPQGFVCFSNPQARKLLTVDTLARRRYPEIFAELQEFARLIAECFEAGTETRNCSLDLPNADGSPRCVEAAILALRDRSNALEAVACLFRAPGPPRPESSR